MGSLHGLALLSVLSRKSPHGVPGPLQISPYVSELSLYDIAGTPGVATDISHINSRAKATVSTALGVHCRACLCCESVPALCATCFTETAGEPALLVTLPAVSQAPYKLEARRARQGSCRQQAIPQLCAGDHKASQLPLPIHHLLLQGYAGDDQLAAALKDADLVIIPAGVPRKPGMTRDDLFKVGFPSPATDLLGCLPLCSRTCSATLEELPLHCSNRPGACAACLPCLSRWAAPLGKAVQQHLIDTVHTLLCRSTPASSRP